MRTGKDAQPKRRALIVDDDELICDYAEIALTAIGFEVQKVLTGEAALDAIQASPPSLVLLDIRLPGMSGLEVLQRMQAMQAPLPVFIGMSVAWESTEREALSLGAAAFLAKPFTIPGLVQTVEAALDGRFVWIDD